MSAVNEKQVRAFARKHANKKVRVTWGFPGDIGTISAGPYGIVAKCNIPSDKRWKVCINWVNRPNPYGSNWPNDYGYVSPAEIEVIE